MSGLPKQILPFFSHFIKKQKGPFFFSQVGSLAWTLDHTLFPVIFMLLIDALTANMDHRDNIFGAITPILLLGAGLWFTIEFGFRMSGLFWAKAIPRMEADVRLEMFNYVQHHSYKYFTNQFAGSLSNKINEMPACMTRILQLVTTLFIPVGFAIVISTTLFTIVQPYFGLILFTWVILHLLICFAFSKKSDTLSSEHAEARSVLAGKIVDSLSNHLNVKLFARFDEERRYINTYQRAEIEKHYKSLWYLEKLKIALGILAFIIPGAILTIYMLYQWKLGTLSNGEVIFVLNSSWNIQIMVILAGLELPNLFREIGIAKQALSIIQEPHEIVNAPLAKNLSVKQGEIIFDNVTFHYTPGRALFKDKSLLIRPGEKIGLVGYSGSGKTSLVHLLLRHYNIDKGNIFIDGQDIATVTLNSLRSSIAMIPQEPLLFHRSLMENVRYGQVNATDADVIEACKKANAHDFIIKLPEGYSTYVGERGIKLSGGQRQRIAIARAILKNAPILILDEATSALDSVTEKHIQEDIHEVMHGRTSIVIAHRLSTIAHMDRILVFENGEVIEEGTHDELLHLSGRYADMWHMQAGGFLPFADEDAFVDDDS